MLHDGTPAIMYTGIDHPHVNYQVQNIAFPKNLSDPLSGAGQTRLQSSHHS
uniref:Incw1 n=1 Tax=Arundo donax TaxID=35708 RepID=A0A0A8ZH00_ARUDO